MRPAAPSTGTNSLPTALLGRVDLACDRFEAAWRAGGRPRIEEALAESPGPERATLLRDLVALEVELRRRLGERPSPVEYHGRFPDSPEAVAAAFSGPEASDLDTGPGPVGRSDGRSDRTTAPGLGIGPDPFLAGKVLGDYELLERIGRGGMGVVYRARQRRAGRMVALKLIHPDQLAELPEDRGRETLARFRDEARAAAGLNHDHIVTVFEVGQVGDIPFYSMRLVEGGSLADLLAAGPLPDDRAAALLEPVARAVQHAHTSGILHRDIKPRNILIDARGRPLVVDFGLVKWLEAPPGMTRSGDRPGTPAYMSPEQAVGGEVGVGSDIYALGATFYEMLTGRPPFRAAEAVETLRQVIDEEPIPPRRLNPAVARDLETICLKCLEKEPGRRYASAVALADDLERWLRGETIAARPVGRLGRLTRTARRRPALAAMAVALLAASLIGLACTAWQGRRVAAARLALAEARVAALLAAEPEAVPKILETLRAPGPDRDDVVASILERRRRAPFSPREQARIDLAFLDQGGAGSALVRRAAVADLRERMLVAGPREFLMIRGGLAPHAPALVEDLWRLAADPFAEPGRSFRAACALAAFDAGDARWEGCRDAVIEALLAQDEAAIGGWTEALRPARGRLRDPLLRLARDPARPERQAAAGVLAGFAEGPGDLVPLVLDPRTDAGQVRPLAAALARAGDSGRAADALEAALAAPADTADPAADARRRANAALALIAMGRPGRAWGLFRHAPDPEVRSRLVRGLALAGVDPLVPIRRLDAEPDPSARRALLLALGGYPAGALAARTPVDARRRLIGRLLAAYRDDPDPGLHSAAEWLLRAWSRDDGLAAIDREIASAAPVGGRRWFVTPLGHALAVVRPPGGRRPAPRPFAIGMKEITREQFDAFLDEHPEYRACCDGADTPGGDPEALAAEVDWLSAVRFCRWLSDREHLPEDQMCYPPLDEIRAGMDLPADFLERPGYRLPTKDEREYAARAGATTPRPSGRSDDLPGQSAWQRGDAAGRPVPVGLPRPNDLGLFDALGLVEEWCQDVDDRGPWGDFRPLRRGPEDVPAPALALGSRGTADLAQPLGRFRVARTLR